MEVGEVFKLWVINRSHKQTPAKAKQEKHLTERARLRELGYLQILELISPELVKKASNRNLESGNWMQRCHTAKARDPGHVYELVIEIAIERWGCCFEWPSSAGDVAPSGQAAPGLRVNALIYAGPAAGQKAQASRWLQHPDRTAGWCLSALQSPPHSLLPDCWRASPVVPRAKGSQADAAARRGAWQRAGGLNGEARELGRVQTGSG
eukprot:scaffold3566_cov18-Tisochrysis_lutea.AAC.5